MGNTKAVLIFSRDPAKDLICRGLSRKFSKLVKIPSLTSKVRTTADIHIFTTKEAAQTLSRSNRAAIHLQKGASFAEKLQNAVDELVHGGYSRIVIVGSDCPELRSGDIHRAFQNLSVHRLVLGPDHRGGCYLIGIHAEDGGHLQSIIWQANSDCAQLQNTFGADNTYLLPIKHDIDSMSDVRILAARKSKWGSIARNLLRQKPALFLAFPNHFIRLETNLQRAKWQLPPPSSLSSRY